MNGKDATDEQLGIGLRPYMDKQVMHLQADVTEWPKELQYEFETDSNGNEYENLVRSQNLEEIELTVKPVGGK